MRINISSHNSLVHPKNYMIKGATAQSSLPKHTHKSTTSLAPISVSSDAGLSSCYFSLCVVRQCVYSTQALFPPSENCELMNK